jgi:hypothetical protein
MSPEDHQMIRDLVSHKGHANMLLLRAIRNHPAAAADAEMPSR